jgi:phosphotransferase system  glucose/maltose/N-acetylglucosamine-specific IIC component
VTAHDRRVLVARILLTLDLAFALWVCAMGLRDVLDPPTTDCGRAAPSILGAMWIVVCALPLIALALYLMKRPTRTVVRTALAAIAVVALTVGAIALPFMFGFGNDFCLVG